MIRLLYLCVYLWFTYSCEPGPISYEQALKLCEQWAEYIWFKTPGGDSVQVMTQRPDHLVGAYLPDFSVISLDSQRINRDSLLGKICIINFWFETCPPCVAEIPGFNTLVERYGHDNIYYLAISTDRAEDMDDFLKHTPFNFIQIPHAAKTTREIFNMRWGFPMTLMTDKNGVILTAFSGGASDESAPQELIDKVEPYIIKELSVK